MAIKQHKLRSGIVIATAIAVIFSALVFSLFRAAIPYITNYGEDIERELTAQLGMRVDIGMIDADISWLVPRLKLLDVSIYDEKDNRHLIHFLEISVSLSWTESIKNLRPELGDIFLFGANLQIERNEKGEFLVQGVNISGAEKNSTADSDRIASFFSDTSLYLVDSTIHWTDEINNSQRLSLTKVNLALINNRSGHKLSIGMDLPAAYGRHVQFMMDFEGNIADPYSWKGLAYIDAENIQLAAWLNDYWEFIGFPGAGLLTANAWVSFDEFSIDQASIRLAADNLVFYHLDENVQAWELEHISALTKWSQTDDGMIINVRDLKVKRNHEAWQKTSAADLTISNANKINLRTNYARIEDLVYFVAISDVIRNDPVLEALSVVDAHSIKGDLYDVNFSIDIEHPEDLAASAYFLDFGYQSTSAVPSVQGLDGYFKMERNQVLLDLDSNDVVLGFGDLFRNEISLEYLAGVVDVGKKGSDWYIDSREIIAQSPHIRTDSKIHMTIPEKGSVFMDIVSLLRQGDGSHTSLYLPAGIMSKETVNWLDTAIVRAGIPQGGFLFYGEVKDFPFKNSEGVMEVLFDVENGRLQYLPDWPAITGLDASLLFYNSSFSIENAAAHIYGADLSNINVSIENLEDAHLSVDGHIESPLSDLVLYVGNSPLKKTLGSFVAGLKTKGSADLDLNLQIPLARNDQLKVRGLLSFKNNEIVLPDQGYMLNAVNGQLLFTESATRADNLQASLAGHAITASVGSHVMDKKKVTRIDVSGHLPVQEVLAPMPMLKEYMDGISHWNINIDIPAAINKNQPAVTVSVKSDLQGVSSVLPLPFNKPADTSVSLKMNLDVFPDNTLTVTLNHDQSNALHARYANHLWDIDLQSPQLTGAIQFSAESMLTNPIRLDIDYLNLSAYMDVAKKTDRQSLTPAELPPLQVKAKEIVWNDISLKNIGLKTRQTKSGMMIDTLRLEGPDIHLTGKGSWVSTWRHEDLTTFDFKLSSPNLGRSLKALTISNSIEDAQGDANFKWSWPAAPYDFKWELLEGTSTLNLKDGKLVDIQPGAGRILGIFNFETLLSLDFGKQVSGGFAFDDMKGAFTFSHGNAYTDDFRIKGKVAEINMKGRVGLAVQDYDQTITVIPGVGSTLSVIGAVAGGPTIGAAILFFQKILGLDKIAKYKYSVTGPWSNPTVALLSAPEKEKKQKETSNDDF